MSEERLDLLIIGAGPAGLSAADAAAREGLSYVVIEKGTIANTIRQYPVGRTLFSTPNELEMREGALKPVREKPTREELLSHYIHFVLDHKPVNSINWIDPGRAVMNQITAERSGGAARRRVFTNIHPDKKSRMGARLTNFDRLARERVATRAVQSFQDFDRIGTSSIVLPVETA